ncbi:battenin-like [Hydractinia symbiolongicarpus]|uniref:battenin-like n=1 Tax=Hydractinia symbiolongicarpus TaxID=13093 RepID=UPI00254A8CA0|nr:battenin-like [Hydractinia symbiolongicarpus]
MNNQPLLQSDRDTSVTLDSNTIGENLNNAKELRRNLIAFWILGLCNNFGYVVMLSAAYNIMSVQNGEADTKKYPGFHCNKFSTGLILLADVLPTLIIKLTAPFYIQKVNYYIRVFIVVLLLAVSLLTLAFSTSVGVSLFAVVLASASSGIGEITFLSISTHFHKTTVSAYSSGTGMAGVAGALSYAGLIATGLSHKNTVLVLLFVPVIFAVAFLFILKMPNDIQFFSNTSKEEIPVLTHNIGQDQTKAMSTRMKLKLVLPLWRYMLPLFFVYLAEYTINQGLYELVYYDVSWLSQGAQYRWFQVDYQIGVFLSRSSVNVFQIRKIIIPTLLQYVILIFVLLEVRFSFVPSLWIMLIVIFVEGLCGGAVYVNAFYLISENVDKGIREFSMGVASVADSFGIALAGGIAIPIHDSLCRLKT